MSDTVQLLTHTPTGVAGRAHVRVDAAARAEHAVDPRLYGKFCEHLGANIYHGMVAQILFNPTLGAWQFTAEEDHPDGGVREASDPERIRQQMAHDAERFGWPDLDAIADGYFNAGLYGWVSVGDDDAVLLSPEIGPYGKRGAADRAQRVEVLEADRHHPRGLGQWTYLPLHRTRTYHFSVVARAAERTRLTLRLAAVDAPRTADQAALVLDENWRTFTGTLTLPEDAAPDAVYRMTLTTTAPANVLLDRIVLYPNDHVKGADPDVIAMLKAAGLPLLRWPGGNFVSGYHWRDGVGRVEARPTVPNPAWSGLEFNLFGTDEFIAFCEAVGCEPMICVNAGDGTPAEAAAWVEYCNGSAETPMGRLRAAYGHPEPYNVRLWEIGNEIYGRWQVGWTTAAGNVDRYERFRAAMLEADPAIEVVACGHGNEPNGEWNQTLIAEADETLETISDHILTGGSVDAETDPVTLYHAFMGYPTVLAERYRELAARMREAGIEHPHLAITENQLFAHFRGEPGDGDALAPERVPRPDTIAEALSLTMIVHMAARLGDFVSLITHSATVNHGGGLRKAQERVWANPVHYAHQMGQAVAGGTPVAIDLACDIFATDQAFAHIPTMVDVPVLDAMAVLAPDGDLVLTLVHRCGDCGPVDVTVEIEGFTAGAQAEVVTLAGETWHDRNTLAAPEKVTPQPSTVEVAAGLVTLTLSPFSVTQVRLAPVG